MYIYIYTYIIMILHVHDAFIGRQERVGKGGPTLLGLGAFFRWEGHVSCIGKENHGVDGEAERCHVAC